MNLLERVTRAICQRRYPLTEEIACCGKCGTLEEQAQAAILAVADDMRLAGIDEDPSGQRREPMMPSLLDDKPPFSITSSQNS